MQLEPSFILFSTKYIALICVAIFGIVGNFGSFKDEQGKVTMTGYASIVGIVISCLLGVFSLSIEQHISYKKNQSDMKQLSEDIKRQSILLKEIDRISMSIDSFTFKIDYEIPFDEKELEGLKNKIIAKKKQPERTSNADFSFIRNSVYVRKNAPILDGLGIKKARNSFPTFVLSLAKSPVNISQVPPYKVFPDEQFQTKYLDRTFLLPTTLLFRSSDKVSTGVKDTLMWHRNNNKYFNFSFSYPNATSLYNSGKITSVLDIPGTTLFLFTPFQAKNKNYQVTNIHVTINRGNTFDWSLNKQIKYSELQSTIIGETLVYFYTFTESDFDIVDGAIWKFSSNIEN